MATDADTIPQVAAAAPASDEDSGHWCFGRTSRNICHWAIILLSCLFILLCASVISIFVLMREITSSVDKFEAVPGYIVALQVGRYLRSISQHSSYCCVLVFCC